MFHQKSALVGPDLCVDLLWVRHERADEIRLAFLQDSLLAEAPVRLSTLRTLSKVRTSKTLWRILLIGWPTVVWPFACERKSQNRSSSVDSGRTSIFSGRLARFTMGRTPVSFGSSRTYE